MEMKNILLNYITQVKEMLGTMVREINSLQLRIAENDILLDLLTLSFGDQKKQLDIEKELNTYVSESDLLIKKFENIVEILEDNGTTIETLVVICDSSFALIDKSNKLLKDFACFNLFPSSIVKGT